MRMVGRLLWANRDVLPVNTAVGTGRGGPVEVSIPRTGSQ